jgi:hypothetical protein
MSIPEGIIYDSHDRKKVLLKVAGQDATKQFDQFHNNAILEKWGPSLYKGDIGANASDVVADLHKEEEKPQALEEGEAFGDMVPFGDPYWYSLSL